MNLTAKQQTILTTLGYETALEFLTHYPIRYDSIEVAPLSEWELGKSYAFRGTLVSAFKHFRYGRKQTITTFSVLVADELVNVTIYNRRFLKETHYQAGITIVGMLDKQGKMIAKTLSNKPLAAVLGIHPLYATKAGIKNYEIERLIHKILKDVRVKERIPEHFREAYQLLPRLDALQACHFPTSWEALKQALRTLKYEEFLMYHVSIAQNQTVRDGGVAKDYGAPDLERLLADLPYTLTAEQQEALHEIALDLQAAKQMNRLLQGDVGSGKTIVAFLAMLMVASADFQAVFLLPTEVLMHQHAHNFKKLFPQQRILTLSQTTSNRSEVLTQLNDNPQALVFGTHALLQDDVTFCKLGLVVIDEQHRFGVKQRHKLLAKGHKVDLLMLSATPIPRTLANSLFFDLDVSSLERPLRADKYIATHLIPENSMRSILEPLHAALEQHEQIYIVCAAITEGEREHVRNVYDVAHNIKTEFSDARIALLHGKMSGSEKEQVMQAFADHTIDILVSTTVIEVGIDVWNANTMIIYNAEQFGLATLHQLRGRVGRGSVQGVCYLLTDSQQPQSYQRLEILEQSQDGYQLSLLDMRERGFGDVLGTRQSGIPHFILGDVLKDEAILKQAKQDAMTIVQDETNPEYQTLLQEISQREYFKSS